MLLLFLFHLAAAVFAGPSDTLQDKIQLEKCLEGRGASFAAQDNLRKQSSSLQYTLLPFWSATNDPKPFTTDSNNSMSTSAIA